MIKGFKKYQKKLTSKDYEVGDYILLAEIDPDGIAFDRECQIINYDKGQYKILTFNKNEKIKLWISSTDIIRKMTEEEIKNYKIKQDAEKYNL